MIGPELTKLIQPVIHFLEWLWLQTIEAALCVHRGFDEPGVAQHAQVLRHGGLRHTQPALDFSDLPLRRGQEAQDRAAVRLRDDGEHGFHVLVYYTEHIPVKAYTTRPVRRAQPSPR